MKRTLEDLMTLVKARGHERYILARLKPFRDTQIGAENMSELIACFTEKDAKVNKFFKYKTNPSKSEWFSQAPYKSFMEFFGRPLNDDKLNQILEVAKQSQIIVPNECNIESIGQVNNPASILRLKKPAKEAAQNLMDLGVPGDYTFVNMKLLVSYYHNIHAPVTGTLTRIVPVQKDLNFFGKNTLWLLEFETGKKPVYLLLVGESAIQDFNFKVKVGDKLHIGDKLGNFMWGSQTVLLFDKSEYNDIQIESRINYFFGTPICSKVIEPNLVEEHSIELP